MYSGCCELCFVQRIRRRSTLHLRVINDRAHEKLKLWQISWEIGKAFRTDTKKVEESWKWKNSFTLAVLTCTRRAERNSQSRKEYWVKRVGGRWVRREWMMLIFMLFIFIIIIRRFQSAQIFVLRRVLRVCRFAGQLELSLNVSYCISWKKPSWTTHVSQHLMWMWYDGQQSRMSTLFSDIEIHTQSLSTANMHSTADYHSTLAQFLCLSCDFSFFMIFHFFLLLRSTLLQLFRKCDKWTEHKLWQLPFQIKKSWRFCCFFHTPTHLSGKL